MALDEGEEGGGGEQRVAASLVDGSQASHAKVVRECIEAAVHAFHGRHHELGRRAACRENRTSQASKEVRAGVELENDSHKMRYKPHQTPMTTQHLAATHLDVVYAREVQPQEVHEGTLV